VAHEAHVLKPKHTDLAIVMLVYCSRFTAAWNVKLCCTWVIGRSVSTRIAVGLTVATATTRWPLKCACWCLYHVITSGPPPLPPCRRRRLSLTLSVSPHYSATFNCAFYIRMTAACVCCSVWIRLPRQMPDAGMYAYTFSCTVTTEWSVIASHAWKGSSGVGIIVNRATKTPDKQSCSIFS